MAIVQSWVYSDFLPDGERRDITSDFSDGAAEFMAERDWELRAGVYIDASFGREEDGTGQVFVKVGAAYTTVGDFESNFVGAALSVLVSARANTRATCCRLTGLVCCPGGCRHVRGILRLASVALLRM